MLQDLSPARHTICCKPRASSASVTFPHSGSLLSPGLLEGSPNLPLSPCVAPCSTCPTGNFFGVCQQPPLQSPKGAVAISASWASCAHDWVDRGLGGVETCPEVPVLVVELALTPPIQQVTPPLSPPGTLSSLSLSGSARVQDRSFQ